MSHQNSMRTPLKTVRGLGSAKSGVHHWWTQRVSAMAMVPLMIWAVYTVAQLPGLSFEEARILVSHPLNATLLLLFLITGFWHAGLGLQVVIEDYVSGEASRMIAILAVKMLLVLLGALSVFSVLQIAL